MGAARCVPLRKDLLLVMIMRKSKMVVVVVVVVVVVKMMMLLLLLLLLLVMMMMMMMMTIPPPPSPSPATQGNFSYAWSLTSGSLVEGRALSAVATVLVSWTHITRSGSSGGVTLPVLLVLPAGALLPQSNYRLASPL
jgi:hypothetical protein